MNGPYRIKHFLVHAKQHLSPSLILVQNDMQIWPRQKVIHTHISCLPFAFYPRKREGEIASISFFSSQATRGLRVRERNQLHCVKKIEKTRCIFILENREGRGWSCLCISSFYLQEKRGKNLLATPFILSIYLDTCCMLNLS